MKVDKVLGSISSGVVTRRHHALLITYCQHHAFVSSFEPLKVHEALVDSDWVIAMQEELECFTRNEVWSLVERPKDHRINVIGTKLGHRSASPAYELSMSAWDVVIDAADRQPAWNQMW